MKYILLILTIFINWNNLLANPNTNGVTATIVGRDTICKGDTTMLVATANGNSGLVTYAWFPNSHINCNICDSARFYPDSTATYTLVTQDSLSSDTSHVTIYVNQGITTSVLVYPNGDTTYYTYLDTTQFIPHAFCPFIVVEKYASGPVSSFNAYPINGGLHPTFQWLINGVPFGTDTNIVPFYSSLDTAYSRGLTLPININCKVTSSYVGCLQNRVSYSFADTITDKECETGINKYNLENSITLSPNPNNGYFIIHIDETSQHLQLELLNLQGQVLFNQQRSNVIAIDYEYNFMNLAKGLYLLKISNENVVVVKRLLVE